jgi:predicted RNA binding protein YcfA (HicA-like mRNA interferase family)
VFICGHLWLKNRDYAIANMPKKIRELKSMLRKAGFTYSSGKGSHTKWYHPLLPTPITLSGNDGDDAKSYQEKDVNNALQQIEEIQE